MNLKVFFPKICNLSPSYNEAQKSTWKNIKKSYKNNKFKIPAPTWNEEFKLPHGSYSISDIQDYFEYVLKKHAKKRINPSIRIYINKVENRIMFKIKKRYFLELLRIETMKMVEICLI